MAVTAPPATGLSPAVPANESPATVLTQVLALVTVGVVLGGLVPIAKVPAPVVVALFFSLVAGFAVGQIFDLRAWCRRLPGIAGGLIVLFLLGAALLLAFPRSPSMALLAPVAALAVLGIDWYWVVRLRVLVWFTAPVALVLAGAKPPASLTVGALWLVAALGTLGAAERDLAVAEELPRSWGSPEPDRVAPAPSLLGSILVGVGLGLLVALLVNLALLNRPQPPVPPAASSAVPPSASSAGQFPQDLDGDGRADRGDGEASDRLADQSGSGDGGPPSGAGSDAGTPSGDGAQPSGAGSDAGRGAGGDRAGSGSGTDSSPGSGSAAGEGGAATGGSCERTRGCIAVPGNGRIVVDEQGRPIVDTDHDGHLDVHRDGRLGVDLDGDGRIDTYDASRIIVDSDADGRIAIDSDGDGVVDRSEPGSVGIDTNGDGVVDRNGRGRVGVDTDGDRVLDDTDQQWIVVPDGSPSLPRAGGPTTTDGGPDVVIAEGVDPDLTQPGQGVGNGNRAGNGNGNGSGNGNGNGSGNADDAGAGGQAPTTTTPPPADEDRSSPLPWLLAILALAIAAVVAVLVFGRRRDDEDEEPALDPLASRQAALSLLEQLEAEGAARGCRRGPNESVVAYGRALVADAMPDPRLHDVVAALDRDLFGPVELSDGERRTVARDLAEVCAAYPPGWQEAQAAAGTEADAEPAGAVPG